MKEPEMKEIEYIRKLDATAGNPPPMDVSSSVLRRIRTARAVSVASDSGPMWIAAALSTLAAAAVLLIAVHAYSGMQDPFSDLLTPLSTVLQ